MDTYESIFEWLVADAKANDSELTPSMLANKASRLANQGYTVVDGELVAPRTTIGFTDEDFEDFK